MKYFIVLFLIFNILALKIHDDILRETSLNGGKTDIIVVMKNQVDVEKINLEKLDNIQIGRKIFNTLFETSKVSQMSIQSFLKKNNLNFKFLWIQKYFFYFTKFFINSKHKH
jgi:hypothetical protein